jgi:hypothetical protein
MKPNGGMGVSKDQGASIRHLTAFGTYSARTDWGWITDVAFSTHEKGPPGLHQRPLNMGQRSDVPLPEVAFMPISALLTTLGQEPISRTDLPDLFTEP